MSTKRKNLTRKLYEISCLERKWPLTRNLVQISFPQTWKSLIGKLGWISCPQVEYVY